MVAGFRLSGRSNSVYRTLISTPVNKRVNPAVGSIRVTFLRNGTDIILSSIEKRIFIKTVVAKQSHLRKLKIYFKILIP